MTSSEKPIVCIVGAARSGTNFIARALAADPRFVNLYENRYVWNYGQKNIRTDRRIPAEANARVRSFIRNHFRKIATETGQIVIDKTPGNALRLEFVREVFPNAKIINIIRDGRASVYSRKMMWEGDGKAKRPPSIGRLFQQIKFMRRNKSLPTSRLPLFFWDNSKHYLAGMLFGRPILAGERVPGIREIARVDGTTRARAYQWRESVLAASNSGQRLGPDAYYEVRLENLLADPVDVFEQIYRFLDLSHDTRPANHVLERSDHNRHSMWYEGLSEDARYELEAMLAPDLDYFGYPRSH